jgi:hypothetical protein
MVLICWRGALPEQFTTHALTTVNSYSNHLNAARGAWYTPGGVVAYTAAR